MAKDTIVKAVALKKVVTKRWYESLTLWANIIALLAVGLQQYTGNVVMSPEAQVGILAIINALLRLKTGKPIALGKVAE